MKIFKLTIATLVALSSATFMMAQTPDEVAAKFNEAAGLMKAKNFPAAITSFEQTIDMGLNADAIDVVQQAQKYLPTCNFYQGLTLAQTGDLEGSLTFLNAANEQAELYGNTKVGRDAKTMISRVYTGLGADAFNNKDYAKAAEIFSKGYAANKQDAALALNLGMSYCEMGELEKGLGVYKTIISYEARNPKFEAPAATAKEKIAYYMTIEAADKAKAGEVDAAYAAIESILAVAPENADAHILRLQTATNAKAWDKVIEWGEAAAAAQTTPEAQSNAYFFMAAAYDSTDDNAKAIETYAKVVEGANADAAKARIAELKALK